RQTLIALDNLDLSEESLRTERQQAIVAAAASCTSSIAKVFSTEKLLSFGIGAGAECTSAMSAMAAQVRQINNQLKQSDNTEDSTLLSLEESMSQHSVTLNQ